MPRFEIVWKRSAAREYRALPASAQRRIAAAVGALADAPYPPGTRKLVGVDDLWRIRVGDYRVVYAVESERVRIDIVRVAHRRDVYR